MNHFCKEASQLQSDGFERGLTVTEHIRLRMHLLICGACRNYSANLELLSTVFQNIRSHQLTDEHLVLPDRERERIIKSLKQVTG